MSNRTRLLILKLQDILIILRECYEAAELEYIKLLEYYSAEEIAQACENIGCENINIIFGVEK